jgi:hypothetical protein
VIRTALPTGRLSEAKCRPKTEADSREWCLIDFMLGALVIYLRSEKRWFKNHHA